MFQLKLEFLTDNNILPSDYRRYIVSFFKKATENYANGFYDNNFNKENNHMKTYTFSTYFPEALITSNNIRLKNNLFVIYFSDSNIKELMHFYNSFLMMKDKKFLIKNNSITLKNVINIQVKDIQSNEMLIKMTSPLLARFHNDKTNKDQYLLYDNPKFQECIKRNIKYSDVNFNLNNFSIVTLDAKKVMSHSFTPYKLPGSLGYFKLDGDKNLLNYLCLSGIGARCGEGFGKFEVVRW